MQEIAADLVDWAFYNRFRAEIGADFVRLLGYFREDGEKAVARIEAAMHRRDAIGLVTPAQTIQSGARQFGAEPLAELAEDIEEAGRRGIETRFFPDHILPQVARLRPLYLETIALLEKDTSPLMSRRTDFDQRPGKQASGH